MVGSWCDSEKIIRFSQGHEFHYSQCDQTIVGLFRFCDAISRSGGCGSSLWRASILQLRNVAAGSFGPVIEQRNGAIFSILALLSMPP